MDRKEAIKLVEESEDAEELDRLSEFFHELGYAARNKKHLVELISDHGDRMLEYEDKNSPLALKTLYEAVVRTALSFAQAHAPISPKGD